MESILKCIFRWEKGIWGKCLPKVMQRGCDKAGICTKVFQNPKSMFSPLYPTSPTPTRTWKTDGNGGKNHSIGLIFQKKKVSREFKRKITFGVWLRPDFLHVHVLFMIYQISNLKRLEIYLCIWWKDMEGTEGSGYCANPQDSAAPFEDLWKMTATPCLCWQLFKLQPDEKNLLPLPFSTPRPHPLLSYQGHNLLLWS